MKHPIARLAGGSLLVAAAVAPVAAQAPVTPRSLGMGGAYTAVARGNEALFHNPANLGLSGNPLWSIAFPQVGLGATVLGPKFEEIPEIADYDNLSDARRSEILAAIPAGGTEAQFDVRAPLASFSSGRFALGLTYGSSGEHTVGKDLVELVFDGYQDGRTDYSVGNTAGSRATYWDVSAAFGHKIGPVSFGVTGHYVRGGTVMRSRMFEPRIDIEAREIEVDYLAVLAHGGTGYGVDFGLAVQPVPSFTLSGAVTNAYAKMTWSEDLTLRQITLRRADFEDANALDLLHAYEGSEAPLDPTSAPAEAFATAQGLYDQAYFPSVGRVAAAWQPFGRTHLAGSYQKKLTEGRLGDRWEQTAAVGLQQKLPLITLQAGYATNLDGGSLVSGGLTLGVLQFGVAKVTDAALDASPRSGWVGTFGVGVRVPPQR